VKQFKSTYPSSRTWMALCIKQYRYSTNIFNIAILSYRKH